MEGVLDDIAHDEPRLRRHRLFAALRRLPIVPALELRLRRFLLTRNLRRLHDALEPTDMTGRYWVWAGMLLGWARDGELIASDYCDVDFAYLAEDQAAFDSAIPALVRAGFAPRYRFRDNDGEITEHTFFRHGAKFEFFKLHPVGDRLRYRVFGRRPGEPLQQLTAEVPAQERVPFDFLGRTWRRAADAESELEAIYGDWRVPDPDWSFFDDGCIVASEAWTNTDYGWR